MSSPIKGRGAQINTSNPFSRSEIVQKHPEGLDEAPKDCSPGRQIFNEYPKKVINKVDSPDLRLDYSVNPYQGCEHGCIYCYARNAHHYWGFSAGLDFESKLIIKPKAPVILEKQLLQTGYKPKTIMLSGNTDCYQPIERKYKLTCKILKVLLRYRHPVGIITKNGLILRDLDILKELASQNLVHVFISLTTLNESLRRIMEPRTVSGRKRLKTVEKLAEAGIPCGVMTAPIIPGLNDSEIPELVKQAADHGARDVSYTVVRLNGAVGELFENWLHQHFPERANRVLNQIRSLHDGRLNDTKWGRRIKGEGNLSLSISQLFKISKRKYFKGRSLPKLDCSQFLRGSNYSLFS